MVLEKTLESPLDCKIKPVNPKGNRPRILIGKDHDAVKIEGRRRMEKQRMRWLDGITDATDMNLSRGEHCLADYTFNGLKKGKAGELDGQHISEPQFAHL